MDLHKDIKNLIKEELNRQQTSLSLIPSENYVSDAVQEAQGSCFTNKYAEGYPGKRYYGGTKFCDELELMCQKNAQKTFNTDYLVNVQAYSGSPANFAVYMGLLEQGDTVMGLNLGAGGHLTHGHKVSATGILFNSVQYTVDEKTHFINYDELEALATEHNPKLIIAGTTAYSRTIDFARFEQIADKVGAYLLADISHISGLVATGLHPSPFGHADVVTTTTHKMLRGPRGALIFSRNDEIATKVNKAIFPGLQGGPHMHTIAAITQALIEAQNKAYRTYCEQIIKNMTAIITVLKKNNFDLITDGSDNHLVLIDLRSKNLTGTEAQEKLEAAGIVANKNGIPFDPAGPFKPSGLRIGTPALTTRGFDEAASTQLAEFMCAILDDQDFDQAALNELIASHPSPSH
jgi:glycine hydroxymethyltransferase